MPGHACHMAKPFKPTLRNFLCNGFCHFKPASDVHVPYFVKQPFSQDLSETSHFK